jgi:hypothetical protein
VATHAARPRAAGRLTGEQHPGKPGCAGGHAARGSCSVAGMLHVRSH